MRNPSSVFGSLSASPKARLLRALDLGDGCSAAIWTNAGDRVRYERPDGHTFSLYLRGGEGTRRLDRVDRRVRSGRPGAVCIMPQGHSSHWDISDAFEFVHLYMPDAAMRRAYAETLDRDARLMALPEITFADAPRLAGALSGLALALADGRSLAAETAMSEALAAAFAGAASNGRALPRLKGGLAPHLARRVAEHVEAHLDGPIRLADLAALAGMSPFHFQRMFAASFGVSPHDFVTHRRLRRARALLRGREPIAQIAAACGFSSQSHLTRAFKAATGMTPAAYRAAVAG